jgi:hypothetical protein
LTSRDEKYAKPKKTPTTKLKSSGEKRKAHNPKGFDLCAVGAKKVEMKSRWVIFLVLFSLAGCAINRDRRPVVHRHPLNVLHGGTPGQTGSLPSASVAGPAGESPLGAQPQGHQSRGADSPVIMSNSNFLLSYHFHTFFIEELFSQFFEMNEFV